MSVGLKKVCRTTRLPGAAKKSATSAASTMTVLVVDRDTLRRLPSPSIRDRREEKSGSPPSASGLDGGDTGVNLQVLGLQPGQRAVAPQRGEGLVDAADQRVALGEQQAVVLSGGRELRHHDRAGDLRGGDVLRGRRVGDQRGDLLVLQRLLHVVQALEDLRRLGRLDRAVDEGGAG